MRELFLLMQDSSLKKTVRIYKESEQQWHS